MKSVKRFLLPRPSKLIRASRFALLFLLTLTNLSSSSLSALSANDISDIINDNAYYDSYENVCTITPGTSVSKIKKLYILGDSITHLAELNVRSALTSPQFGYEIVGLNADSGRAITYDYPAPGSPGLDAVKADKTIISSADAVVVALGTNSGNENLDTKIPELVEEIRIAKPDVPIFWVNLFYTKNINERTERNTSITNQSKPEAQDYTVLDMTNAGIELLDDGTHPTASGNNTFATSLAEKLKAATQVSTGASYDPTVLSFPAFPNKASIGPNITNYIRQKTPNSPFLTIPGVADIGSWIVDESEARNINPLFIAGSGRIENNYGTIGDAPAVNNFFGMKGPDNNYLSYPTPQAGIQAFMDKIKANIYSGGAFGKYMAAKNMYEYFSVHQSGVIAYPGEDLDPNDESGPTYDSSGNLILKRDTPDGNRKDGYDSYMGVYISWTVTDHPNNRYDNDLYNPLYYHRINIDVVNAVTGLSLSSENPQRIGGSTIINSCTGQSTNPSTGEASKYVPDCSANGGNAAIACTAINQLLGIPYSQTARAAADDPNPKFLDCSAFTGMAVYRAFGVNLGGICSTHYLTSQYFEQIDVKDIQPGDLVGKGTGCATGGGGGHIAVVVSYDKSTGKLITAESSSTLHPSGIRGIGGEHGYNVGLAVDGQGTYIWAVRYIGPKILQPGAN